MPTDEEFVAGNLPVIEEFRAHRGVVADLEFPILLLTTTGARTGRRRTTPLGFSLDGSRVFVVASKGGAPHHPAWFHNLSANPSVTVELGSETYEARAVVAEGQERDRLFAIIRANAPGLAKFEEHATRVIPVVVLEGVSAPTATDE
jgi:deazaflavin-dependent oxidoreductase (nitroreductase family)